MGMIGRILSSFVEDSIREITTEIYEGYTKQSRQVLPPGIDSNPLPEDQGVLIMIDNNPSKTMQIGVYPDPQVDKGEIRIFSRNSSGTQQAEIHLKDDGLILINNQVEDLKTLINDLITEIKAITTTGSPTLHTVSAASQALLDTLNTRFNTLLGV